MQIDLDRDALLTAHGVEVLKDRYMVPGETSPQHAFARAAAAFADDDAHAQRLYDYVSKHWFMFATPVLSNGGLERGLPISCFLSYVPDSLEGIFNHWAETGYLSSAGGGVGGYWGDLRSSGESTSRGSASNGVLPFMKVIDVEMLAVSQGKTRRGSYATYMDIDHPEIEEFIAMRKPSGGDEYRKCLNLHHGVNIPDAFMEIIEECQRNPQANDEWDLIDPHSKRVVKTVSARKLWQSILSNRVALGEPFIHFIDTSNAALPRPLRDAGLKIRQSNLCTEIFLPTNEDRTAVCCLSSVNADKWVEWKEDPLFIEDLMRMLDNVLTSFIERVRSNPKFQGLSKAAFSAERERSVGLGLMGFHSLLQQNSLPFESALAVSLNKHIFRHLDKASLAASKKLAEERGEAPDMVGTGERFAHRLANAPNASSSIICGGVSPGIEPVPANIFTEKTLSGSKSKRNPYLAKLISEKAVELFAPYPHDHLAQEIEDWVDDQWAIIIADGGSVQSLEWLDDWNKDVFKTAFEIDQQWIIQHAGVRQPMICQGQSVNLFFTADATIAELHATHFQSWKQGLKSLYYVRSKSIARPENISKQIAARVDRVMSEDDVCLSCES